MELVQISKLAQLLVAERRKQMTIVHGGKHPSDYTLIPFVLKQLALSKHVQLFIQSASKHEPELSGGAWPVSAIVQRWKQKISM